MKSTFLKVAFSAAALTGAAPAFADLILVTGTPTNGTGQGNVSTVVTVQDNNNGKKQNGIESGCVTPVAGNPAFPPQTCQVAGIEGGDNTSGNVGGTTYYLDDIDGLANAGQLGFVVNISEGAPGNSATLTDLYLSLFNTLDSSYSFYEYKGPDLVLSEGGGIGQSGSYRFVLNKEQADAAIVACPVLSQCILGGGIQFALGTTQATPETVYVGGFLRDDDDGSGNPGSVPEPGSVALLGVGALAAGALRRRRGARK